MWGCERVAITSGETTHLGMPVFEFKCGSSREGIIRGQAKNVCNYCYSIDQYLRHMTNTCGDGTRMGLPILH